MGTNINAVISRNDHRRVVAISAEIVLLLITKMLSLIVLHFHTSNNDEINHSVQGIF